MRAAPRYTALVADDHPLVRSGLVGLLQAQGNISVVGEAADGVEAVSLAKSLKPDLMTLDIAMPFAQGIAVFTEVKRWSPDTRVAVFSGVTSSALLQELCQSGAEGVFTKRGDMAEFAEAIPMLLRGQKIVSSDAVRLIEAAQSPNALTSRERQIMSLIANGQTTRSIAETLGVSPKTIENHRTNIMTKIGVNSMAGLLAYALREGLLDGQSQL
ncbi:response regulator transcription factor [Loktanella sp. IMCC34160]|uniref:response regulator transcription factor n=1 Tax=Loktanella sp. IMCC34160 TaxID=2510646 RepID=UPI00101E0BE9|nr:response regulator transcription factor [Loktanella sp. IMCC34160]RYG89222.1 response regulator transcription factor [Loktanella sp. IMCC34160]